MRKRKIILATILGVIILGGIMAGPLMSNVEIPNYKIIKSEDNIEIRRYDPMIIAEVEMTGNREETIGNGFRLLADYIFGNNTFQKDIAMTAPVEQKMNHKIAMTAPVQQESMGDSWKVSFVMPSKYTMQSLPKPNNNHVELKEIASKQFVVIRFSGKNSDLNITEHEKKLKKYIAANDFQAIGFPKYAFYNPPWTFPPMRRNEVMIEIKNQVGN